MGRLTVYYIIQSDGIVLFWIDQDYKIDEVELQGRIQEGGAPGTRPP